MPQSSQETVVIIGAGHGGGEAAVALHQAGWQGSIVLIGEERLLPYHRPPLSKAFLTGQINGDSLALKPEAAYAKAGVQVRLGTRVQHIDRGVGEIQLDDGERISYTWLILATGGRPRPLPMAGLDAEALPANFHYLRTTADAEAIRAQLEPGRRLAIIGGGYIGLEVAASARKQGLEVTVLEAMPRVLARVTAPEVSAFYERIHHEAGVRILTETGVERIEYENGLVSGLVCADGTRIATDLVVAGIGLLPNVELAQQAGLEVDNGVLVDEFTRTSDPRILAVGDCSNHPNPIYGRRLRLESVPNALEQARVAAALIGGKPKAHASVPWFWSDQYDYKLQMVGLSQGYDQVILRGSPDSGSFVAFYLHKGQLLAADAINRPQEFMLAKRLVAAQLEVDPAQLSDEDFALKALLETVS